MCQREFVIRAVGTKTDRGWAIKTVLNRQSDAERFHGHWLRRITTGSPTDGALPVSCAGSR